MEGGAPNQASTPTGAVFLSYASQDAEAARSICDALRSAGIEVWFDQSELRGGDAWDHKIRQQIHDCALFSPIISKNRDCAHTPASRTWQGRSTTTLPSRRHCSQRCVAPATFLIGRPHALPPSDKCRIRDNEVLKRSAKRPLLRKVRYTRDRPVLGHDPSLSPWVQVAR